MPESYGGTSPVCCNKHWVTREWLERATAYCWRVLPEARIELGPAEAIAALAFLEYVPEHANAEAEFGRLDQRILTDLVACDPATVGYMPTPPEFAPRPDS